MTNAIINKATELFKKLDGDIKIDTFLSHKDEMKELAKACEGEPIFIKSKNQYLQLVANTNTIKDEEQRIIHVWNHLLRNMNNAPTTLHFRSSITLIFPALNHFIQDYQPPVNMVVVK